MSFPAWVVILEYFVVNLYDAFTAGQSGGVAFAAHVGGFVAGFVLLRLMQKREAVEYDPWERLLGPRARGA